MTTLYTAPFLLMGLANFSSIASFACFYLFPLFLVDRGASQTDVGLIMGSFSLSAVLCRPWVAAMIDRFGRKRSLTVGTLIMTVVPLAYIGLRGGLHETYVFLLLIRIFHGIGLALCSTAVFTYIVDIIPTSRLNEGLGIFGVSGLIGLAVGPVLAEMVIYQWGFTFHFLLASLLGLVAMASHLGLRESYVKPEHEASPSFFHLFRRKKLLMVAVLAALFGIAAAASGGFVAPYAKTLQLRFVAVYYVSYSLAAVLTRFGGARLGDRIGEHRLLPYALILSGTGLLLMTLLHGSAILALAGLLSGCGHGFLCPSLNALAVRDEPISIRGKVTGFFTGSIEAGVFLGSLLLGYVGDWLGFRALFLAAGCAVLLGLIVCPWRSAVVGIPKPPLQAWSCRNRHAGS
ncbi:MAG TPA: MFS transporter [Syntrophobacteraceae bacterium]|nr:MFS transporter [Syntrophobacteraceae bacterium]